MTGNTRVNLRKILGWREDVAAWDKQANRPRIHAGRGVAWFDGHGENGKLPKGADIKELIEEIKEDDLPDIMPPTPPTPPIIDMPIDDTPLPPPPDPDNGREIRAFEGLYSGSVCVNVRLDGRAVVPDGWVGICNPGAPTCETELIFHAEPNMKPYRIAVGSMDEAIRHAYDYYTFKNDYWRRGGRDERVPFAPIKDIILHKDGRNSDDFEPGQFSFRLPASDYPVELNPEARAVVEEWLKPFFEGGCHPVSDLNLVDLGKMVQSEYSDSWWWKVFYNGKQKVREWYIDTDGRKTWRTVELYASIRRNYIEPPDLRCHELILTADGFKWACDNYNILSEYQTPQQRIQMTKRYPFGRGFIEGLITLTKEDNHVVVHEERFNKTLRIDLSNFIAAVL